MSRAEIGTFVLLYIATNILVLTPASAFLTPIHINNCSDGHGDERIRNCTGLIESRRFTVMAFIERAKILEARGEGYTDTRQYALAVADFDEAIRLGGGYAHAYYNRCRARAMWGEQLSEALDDCNRAIGEVHQSADALNWRALVNYRLGKYADTIADATSVVAINERMASAFYLRGLAKLKQKDSSGSAADLAAADMIDSTIATTFKDYGVTRPATERK